jgi:hypothetical protein
MKWITFAETSNCYIYMYVCQDFCLFACLFIAAWAIFQLSGGCHHYRWQGCKFRPMLGVQGLWAGRDLYRTTPTATRDLGLYGLIRKTGTHVPQWDLNPRLKDHQIFEPDALTTAPHDDFDFAIVKCPFLCSNIPLSPPYGVYISQLIRYCYDR